MFEKQPETVKTCFKCGEKTKDLHYVKVPNYGHGWVCNKCKEEAEKNK